MNWRWDEWSERVSAVVLLAASVLVAQWSREHVASTEAVLDRRERQLDRLAAWARGVEPVEDACGQVDFDGLFGAEQVVITTSPVGRHVTLRACAEVAR